MRTFSIVGSALAVALFSGTVACATEYLSDGTFQNSIGTGSNLTPWSDWTAAGITRATAPAGTPGNMAVLPIGADLFQRFAALAPGKYELSFEVRNASSATAKLPIAIQQALGTDFATLESYGTGEILTLSPSSTFQKIALGFSIVPGMSFVPNELTFSNSYDAPYGALSGTTNATGTVIDVANVSIESVDPLSHPGAVPEPATWAMMLVGVAGVGASLRGRRSRRAFA
jgi:hypothetical protein